uniref:Uncharacterized protein n=1 Tax=Ganoderma tsugae TaxID=2075311 RepID=A0A2S1WBA3_GANTS|nr:hypothetical protein [Ganoderma tsugae]AWJ63854.1 hypothetical protein [Ganoderma tsugae]
MGLFNITVHTGGLHMSIKPEMDNYLNLLVKEIDEKLNQYTEISKEIKKDFDSKRIHNPSHPQKRGIHTSVKKQIDESNSLNLPGNLNSKMLKNHPRINEFLIKMRDRLDNTNDSVEAQRNLEENWIQEMNYYLSSDKNIIKTNTSNMSLLSAVTKTVELINE